MTKSCRKWPKKWLAVAKKIMQHGPQICAEGPEKARKMNWPIQEYETNIKYEGIVNITDNGTKCSQIQWKMAQNCPKTTYKTTPWFVSKAYTKSHSLPIHIHSQSGHKSGGYLTSEAFGCGKCGKLAEKLWKIVKIAGKLVSEYAGDVEDFS